MDISLLHTLNPCTTYVIANQLVLARNDATALRNRGAEAVLGGTRLAELG